MTEEDSGYARPNYDLTSAQRARNEEALRGFVAISGGVVGLVTSGVRFADLSHILEARPDDPNLDLLILLSERLVTEPLLAGGALLEERPITPEMAQQWLSWRKRAETQTGDELSPDHLTLAARMIAEGTENRLLSEVYAEVTDNPWEIPEDMIVEISAHLHSQIDEDLGHNS